MAERNNLQKENPQRVMPLLSIVHLMENGVPHRRFHVCAVVFIKTMAGAAVAAVSFERLPDFQIIRKLLFAFVGHGGNDCGQRPVNLLIAFLFVSRDT